MERIACPQRRLCSRPVLAVVVVGDRRDAGRDEPNEGVLLPLLPLHCERPDEVNLANAALIDCPCTPPLLPVPRPSAVNIAALRIASL